MKTRDILAVLVGATLFQEVLAQDVDPEVKFYGYLRDAAVKADSAYVVEALHPKAITGYAQWIRLRTGRIAAEFGSATAQLMTGLDDKGLAMPDQELVSRVLRETMAQRADAIKEESTKPLRIHGVLAADSKMSYLVYDVDAEIGTFRSPYTLAFRADGEKLQLWSFFLQGHIESLWSKKLAEALISQQSSEKSLAEQGGADQPATAPDSKPEVQGEPITESEARPK